MTILCSCDTAAKDYARGLSLTDMDVGSHEALGRDWTCWSLLISVVLMISGTSSAIAAVIDCDKKHAPCDAYVRAVPRFGIGP